MDIQPLKEKVADACRILSYEADDMGLTGHVSVRIPNSDRFLVLGHVHHTEPGRGIRDATPDDIIACDLEGRLVEGRSEPPSEIVIHSAVYKARRDVNSVAHCHPQAATALSIAGQQVLPVNVLYMLSFSGPIPILDLGARLIITKEDGEALVKALGAGKAVVQRGHGIVAVGGSVEEATVNAIFVEKMAQSQLIAAQVGSPRPFIEGRVGYSEEDLSTVIDTHWHYFIKKLRTGR